MLIVLGCDAPGPPATAPLAIPDRVVEINWLRQNLEHLTLVDAREPLAFHRGHLPMAGSLPSDATFSAPGQSKLAPLNQFDFLATAAGISLTRPVVVYDSGTLEQAARVFWTLEVLGHRQVAVLNGGLAAWLSSSDPTLSKEPATPTAQPFLAKLVPERLATKLAVRQAVDDPSVALLDVRSFEEFQGRMSLAARSGRIPGATFLDWRLNLEELQPSTGQHLINRQQLRQLYAPWSKSSRVITYCNRGGRSTVVYLGLRRLGLDVAVYDGSWLEWGNDNELPITAAGAN